MHLLIDVPLPGGGYVNQGSIGAATVNHVVQSATPPVAQAVFKPGSVYRPSSDPQNKSGTVGTVIGIIIDVAAGAEVVDDEEVDGEELAELRVVAVVEAGVTQRLEEAVRARDEHEHASSAP